jgi:polyisoprenoid-binding protein YceI
VRYVLCLTAALLAATPSVAARFALKAGAPNQVVFVSKAATETFEGKTDQIAGSIEVDPAAIGDSVTVHFEVAMASLDTGIGKRNQHMRENHLETAKYPTALFDGAAVLGPKDAALAVGAKTVFDVEGQFTLHGVTRRLRVAVDVTLVDAQTLEFAASFQVPLADYAISRPRFLFLKLGEVQDVRVKGRATRSSE